MTYLPRYDQEYALGFAFNGAHDHVVLIEKNRPQWQAGKLNGVGGHVEEGEEPIEAMCREFEEEAGVPSWPDQWSLFAIMSGSDAKTQGRTSCAVFCYETDELPLFTHARTMTDERVKRIAIEEFDRLNLIPNLFVLIPLALSRGLFQRPAEFIWAPSY